MSRKYTAKEMRYEASRPCASVVVVEMLRQAADEIERLRDVVYALKACPGIRNCLIKGCASCSHHENGCNSKAVVVALRRFNESEEVSNGQR